METILIIALLCAGVVAFGINLANKWNILDSYEIHRKSWMPAKCIFCLSFWLSCLVLTLLLEVFGVQITWKEFIVVVALSSSVTLKLLP